MFLLNKNRTLLAHLEDYYRTARETLALFLQAVEQVVTTGIDAHFEALALAVSEKEQNCDEIRRSIEREMYAQSLLPETREDLLEILEKLDLVPNHCEKAAYLILDQGTRPIVEIREDMVELTKVGLQALDFTIEAARDCLGKIERSEELVRQIDDCESLGRKLERKMVRTIFSSEKLRKHSGKKVVQKELVGEVGAILSKCKHVMERISITAIKRRV